VIDTVQLKNNDKKYNFIAYQERGNTTRRSKCRLRSIRVFVQKISSKCRLRSIKVFVQEISIKVCTYIYMALMVMNCKMAYEILVDGVRVGIGEETL